MKAVAMTNGRPRAMTNAGDDDSVDDDDDDEDGKRERIRIARSGKQERTMTREKNVNDIGDKNSRIIFRLCSRSKEEETDEERSRTRLKTKTRESDELKFEEKEHRASEREIKSNVSSSRHKKKRSEKNEVNAIAGSKAPIVTFENVDEFIVDDESCHSLKSSVSRSSTF